MRRDSSTFPTQTAKAASDFMRVYYYPNAIPDNFELVEDSVNLSGGILTFQLRNPKSQSVTVVEQSLPNDLQSSEVLGSDRVDGALGSATVNFKEGRAIGVLLTKDKQTMITLNSADGLETSTMKDLLRGLRPL